MKSLYRYMATFFLGLMLSTQCVDVCVASATLTEEVGGTEEVREDPSIQPPSAATQDERGEPTAQPKRRRRRKKKDTAAAAKDEETSIPGRIWGTFKRHPKKIIATTLALAFAVAIGRGVRSVVKQTKGFQKIVSKLVEDGVVDQNAMKRPFWLNQFAFFTIQFHKENVEMDQAVASFLGLVEQLKGSDDTQTARRKVLKVATHTQGLIDDPDIGRYLPSAFLKELIAEVS